MPISLQLFILSVYALGCGVSQSLMSLGGSLLALAMLWDGILLLKQRKSLKFDAKQCLCLSLGSLWIFYSVLNLALRPWDENSTHTLTGLPLLAVPLFAVTSLALGRKWPREKMAWPLSFALVGLFASLGYSIYQYFVLQIPATGFMKNPIYSAYNLFPAFLLFAELFWRAESFGFFKRSFSGAAMLLALLNIILSESRMIWACVALYLMLRFLPLLWKRAGKAISLVLVLLLGATAFGLYSTQPRMRDKIQRSFSADDPSRVWRLVAWKHNWELFKENPFFGVGLERNGIDVARDTHYAGHWKPGHQIYAHSIYLQSLADSGVIGTLLFFGFWIVFVAVFPASWPLLLMVAIAGLTENIFNNSRAAHAVFFYSCLMAILIQSTKRDGSIRN